MMLRFLKTQTKFSQDILAFICRKTQRTMSSARVLLVSKRNFGGDSSAAECCGNDLMAS